MQYLDTSRADSRTRLGGVPTYRQRLSNGPGRIGWRISEPPRVRARRKAARCEAEREHGATVGASSSNDRSVARDTVSSGGSSKTSSHDRLLGENNHTSGRIGDMTNLRHGRDDWRASPQ